MPMPVSCTASVRCTPSEKESSRRMSKRTSPCWVNFTALLNRLLSICERRNGSPTKLMGTSEPISTTKRRAFPSVICSNRLRELSTEVPRSKGMDSTTSFPASILEKSKISFTTPSRLCPEARHFSIKLRSCGGKLPSRARRVRPNTPFMGVRISWDMLARNSDLAKLARCASSRASSACCAASFSSVMSRMEAINLRVLLLPVRMPQCKEIHRGAPPSNGINRQSAWNPFSPPLSRCCTLCSIESRSSPCSWSSQPCNDTSCGVLAASM